MARYLGVRLPRDGLEGIVTSGAGRNQVFGARLSERWCGRHSSLSLHLQCRGWNVDQVNMFCEIARGTLVQGRSSACFFAVLILGMRSTV